jgi:hypothetical protein
MRTKTDLERIGQRGQIHLEIQTVRSTLKPQLWEIRKLIRWMRLEHRVRNAREKLSPETQVALVWAEEALEREFLFGKE